MEITKETIIGDVVTADYKAASVFKKYGIDFCCNGNRSIAAACEKENINTEKVLEDLKNVENQTGGRSIDYTTWPLDLLADYIEKTHHRYVETKTTEIKPYLDKIVKVHGDNHPELAEVAQLFDVSGGNLAMHMKKEELMFFPRIRKMAKAEAINEMPENLPLEAIKKQIETFLKEHDDEGENYRIISSLTNGYTPPSDACNTYKVTLAMLQEFEEDLHLHIHLENNILFPKSIQLAEKLSN